jgi:SAM-dependent methyltransferase
MLLRGAREVVAIDSWTTIDAVPEVVRSLPGFIFQQSSILNWEQTNKDKRGKFDLVFSNTVTEHIGDLPSAFDVIARLVQPDGLYFNNHDNYYSPCGSHDHGFWFYGANGCVDFQGINCWAMEKKCAASHEHRSRVAATLPWTWPARNDDELTPENCALCRYFRRSQPWAHLRYVDEFVDLYNDKSFVTAPRPASSLNKITPFLLRQLLNEAGFKIVKWHRTYSANKPDEEILDLGIAAVDLTTQTILTLCETAGGRHAQAAPDDRRA